MKVVGALVVVIVLGGACTPDDEAPVASPPEPPPFADGYELIADQPYRPEESNDLAVVVTTERDMKPLWHHFLLGGRVGSLREGREVALFVGTGESGTCPIELEGLTVENGNVRLETAEHDGLCTADDNPRTFVLLFLSRNAPEAGGIVFLEGTELLIKEPADILS